MIAKAASCVGSFLQWGCSPESRKKATDLKQQLTNDSAAVSRQNVAKPHPIPCDNLLTFTRVEAAGEPHNIKSGTISSGMKGVQVAPPAGSESENEGNGYSRENSRPTLEPSVPRLATAHFSLVLSRRSACLNCSLLTAVSGQTLALVTAHFSLTPPVTSFTRVIPILLAPGAGPALDTSHVNHASGSQNTRLGAGVCDRAVLDTI